MREKVGVMKSLTTRMVKVGAMKQVGAMRSFKLKRISNHKGERYKGKEEAPDRGMEKGSIRSYILDHNRPFDEDMKTFDAVVSASQADDMDEPIGTQSLEGLSQASYVPDFDPSQTNNDNDASDWWTPMTNVRKLRKGGSKQSNAPVTSAKWDRWTGGPSKKLQLSDSPMAADGSPQASLYYFTEESWDRFTKWSTNPTALRIGPSEMDAMMYIWREKTSLRRWNIDRVAFMNAMFCLQIEKEYEKCKDDKRGYVVPDLLLAYGRGELPSHGRTNRVWGVDVDRLYFPLFVNGNHWVAVCVNMIEKKVEVYDCNRGRNRQYVEKFACMIPRIVKAVGPPKSKLLLTSYSIVDMPMQTRLNKSCADYGHSHSNTWSASFLVSTSV
ncbi:hypothetical protein Bca52824_005297 [Brassica carinata]|uniref:Ubiquitin-like protease family profile domain-containing protein n=1 Tax=Brassica carinata TaxID=52824 RepID=A0A8X8BG59_BRACI|nr:hypothetical protein Bca52824_005297 [Brassica carinata]